MQQRYYDPGIGRFLSVDPVTADGNTGANFNRYWYASDNPYRFSDPDGRCGGWFCDFFGLQGAPEAIRDRTFDRADAIRGHDGRMVIGAVAGSGGAGAGAAVLTTTGAAAATVRVAQVVNAKYTSAGITVYAFAQVAATRGSQAANAVATTAQSAHQSAITSSVATTGNFQFFNLSVNAVDFSSGILTSLANVDEPSTSGSNVLGSAVVEVGRILAQPQPPPPPPRPPSIIENSH